MNNLKKQLIRLTTVSTLSLMSVAPTTAHAVFFDWANSAWDSFTNSNWFKFEMADGETSTTIPNTFGGGEILGLYMADTSQSRTLNIEADTSGGALKLGAVGKAMGAKALNINIAAGKEVQLTGAKTVSEDSAQNDIAENKYQFDILSLANSALARIGSAVTNIAGNIVGSNDGEGQLDIEGSATIAGNVGYEGATKKALSTVNVKSGADAEVINKLAANDLNIDDSGQLTVNDDAEIGNLTSTGTSAKIKLGGATNKINSLTANKLTLKKPVGTPDIVIDDNNATGIASINVNDIDFDDTDEPTSLSIKGYVVTSNLNMTHLANNGIVTIDGDAILETVTSGSDNSKTLKLGGATNKINSLTANKLTLKKPANFNDVDIEHNDSAQSASIVVTDIDFDGADKPTNINIHGTVGNTAVNTKLNMENLASGGVVTIDGDATLDTVSGSTNNNETLKLGGATNKINSLTANKLTLKKPANFDDVDINDNAGVNIAAIKAGTIDFDDNAPTTLNIHGTVGIAGKATNLNMTKLASGGVVTIDGNATLDTVTGSNNNNETLKLGGKENKINSLTANKLTLKKPANFDDVDINDNADGNAAVIKAGTIDFDDTNKPKNINIHGSVGDGSVSTNLNMTNLQDTGVVTIDGAATLDAVTPAGKTLDIGGNATITGGIDDDTSKIKLGGAANKINSLTANKLTLKKPADGTDTVEIDDTNTAENAAINVTTLDFDNSVNKAKNVNIKGSVGSAIKKADIDATYLEYEGKIHITKSAFLNEVKLGDNNQKATLEFDSDVTITKITKGDVTFKGAGNIGTISDGTGSIGNFTWSDPASGAAELNVSTMKSNSINLGVPTDGTKTLNIETDLTSTDIVQLPNENVVLHLKAGAGLYADVDGEGDVEVDSNVYIEKDLGKDTPLKNFKLSSIDSTNGHTSGTVNAQTIRAANISFVDADAEINLEVEQDKIVEAVDNAGQRGSITLSNNGNNKITLRNGAKLAGNIAIDGTDNSSNIHVDQRGFFEGGITSGTLGSLTVGRSIEFNRDQAGGLNIASIKPLLNSASLPTDGIDDELASIRRRLIDNKIPNTNDHTLLNANLQKNIALIDELLTFVSSPGDLVYFSTVKSDIQTVINDNNYSVEEIDEVAELMNNIVDFLEGEGETNDASFISKNNMIAAGDIDSTTNIQAQDSVLLDTEVGSATEKFGRIKLAGAHEIKKDLHAQRVELKGSKFDINPDSDELILDSSEAKIDNVIIDVAEEKKLKLNNSIIMKDKLKFDLKGTNDSTQAQVIFDSNAELDIDDLSELFVNYTEKQGKSGNRSTKLFDASAATNVDLKQLFAKINFKSPNTMRTWYATVGLTADSDYISLLQENIAEIIMQQDLVESGREKLAEEDLQILTAFKEFLDNLTGLTSDERAEAVDRLMKPIGGATSQASAATSAQISDRISVSAPAPVVASGDNEPQPTRGLWMKPFVGWATQDAIKNQDGNNSIGYKMKSVGGTIGFDGQINNKYIVGIGLTAVNSGLDYHRPKKGDSTRLHSYFGSIYGVANMKHLSFFRGVISLGTDITSNEVLRPDVGSRAIEKSSFSTQLLSAEFALGKHFIKQNYVLTPSVGFRMDESITPFYAGIVDSNQEGKYGKDTFTEKSRIQKSAGIFDMKFTSKGRMIGNTRLSADFSGKVTHTFSTKDDGVKRRIEGAINNFAVQKGDKNKTSYNLGVGLNFNHRNKLQYGVTYNAGFAEKFQSNQLSVSCRLLF